MASDISYSFNPLWINTALKRDIEKGIVNHGFNPLWINTALKLQQTPATGRTSFNPLWINTALKHNAAIEYLDDVSIPYGLTLLSNSRWVIMHVL